jgi:hypothetical protein
VTATAFATWLKQSKGSMPKDGIPAVHTKWYDIGTITYSGKVLHVGDLWYHGEEGDASIKITPGRFRVQAKGAVFGQHHRTAAVRIYAGKEVPKTGKVIGEVLVDSWSIFIGDLKDLYLDFADDETAIEKWRDKNLFGRYAKGVEIKEYKVGKRQVPCVVAFAGLGSGGYDAKALMVGRKTVGIEVEFIAEGLQMDSDESME